MLTPMQIQYLVGLCCLRHNPEAVDVTLGAWVHDDSIDEERDVDVTVTVRSDNGQREAIAGFEVKKEAKPLDVTHIEQLALKMSDMPSLSQRSIVSASGYYSNCLGKARKHGIVLYDLAPWESPVRTSFPNSALESTPANSILFSQTQLVWLDGVSLKVNPSDPRRELWVALPKQEPIFDATGKPLGTCDDLIKRLLSKTAVHLGRSGQVKPAFSEPLTTHPNKLPNGPIGKPVRVDDLVVKVGEPINVSIDGRPNPIEEVIVSGEVQWMYSRQKGTFHIMRRHDDPTLIYAGAAVCEVPDHEDLLMASLLSKDDTQMAFHLIHLSQKHKNMIREIKLRSRSPCTISMTPCVDRVNATKHED